MKFVNVGALDTSANRFKTKTALKNSVKQDLEEGSGDLIAFDQTAFPHDGSLPGTIVLGDIPEGVVLSVVGPDPYSSRKWYANVERKGDQVTVK